MATDIQIIKERLSGQAGTYGLAASGVDGVDSLTNFVVSFSKGSDDAMASTTTAETYTGKFTYVKARLKAVYFVATTGGITANGTNYATVTISKRDSAAANKLTVASFATDTVTTDDVTQGAPKAFDLTAANIVVDALSTFTFEIAKAASGVVVRAGEFHLVLERV